MAQFLGFRLTISSLIFGFIALAVIVAMTFWLNVRTEAVFQNVVTARTLDAEAVEVRSALEAAESSQRGYLYTQNEIYLAPLDVAKSQALKQLNLLRSGLTEYPDMTVVGAKLTEVAEKKIAEIDRTVLLLQQGNKAEAFDLFQTNQGKALMDEANVYINGIARQADQRIIDNVAEQRSNASELQIVSILSALAILAVVAIVTYLFMNHSRSLNTAQREVTALNAELELRVQRRTDDLASANAQLSHERDRAEALLDEVNHRVANSLTMVSSLVKMQARNMRDAKAKNALEETRDRIHAVALVHRKLYTSGDARYVLLDDYLGGLVSNLQSSIQDQKLGISLQCHLAHMKMPVDRSVDLGVIVNEWVSNAVKYAYPNAKGEVRIDLATIDDNTAQLTVADSGVGFDCRKESLGTGFGTKIVGAMATSLSGIIRYRSGSPGTVASITFPFSK